MGGIGEGGSQNENIMILFCLSISILTMGVYMKKILSSLPFSILVYYHVILL